MYGIFTYICHTNQPNVGKYAIHGCYGPGYDSKDAFEVPRHPNILSDFWSIDCKPYDQDHTYMCETCSQYHLALLDIGIYIDFEKPSRYASFIHVVDKQRKTGSITLPYSSQTKKSVSQTKHPGFRWVPPEEVYGKLSQSRVPCYRGVWHLQGRLWKILWP